jgi:hypothetical protein
LFHPGIANLSCETCLKYVTDIPETGEVKTYGVTNPETGLREQVPQPRPQGTLPPCERCPKGSPEQAKEIELSEKNWLAFGHYRQAKAVGVTETERRDPIVRRNFAVIDLAFKTYEMCRTSQLQAHEFAKLFKRD